MNTSKNHYNQHLAAVYSWTSGTPEAAIQRNRDFFCKLGIDSIQRGLAIDLGTGPGFQAIPTSSVLLNPGVNLCVGVAHRATPTHKFIPKISPPPTSSYPKLQIDKTGSVINCKKQNYTLFRMK